MYLLLYKNSLTKIYGKLHNSALLKGLASEKNIGFTYMSENLSKLRLLVRCMASLIVCGLLSACFVPDSVKEADKMASMLLESGVLKSNTISTSEGRFHFVTQTGDEASSELIVFIHGTPGSWTIFGPQFQSDVLTSHARLIGLDRPGWGQTRMNSVAPESLLEQSVLIGQAIEALLEAYAAEKIILVGHSYGASLVTRIALDYPNIVDGVVTLAGDLDPNIPAENWYNKIASKAPVRWFMTDAMERANNEVKAISPGLSLMEDRWKKINAPVLVVQGEKDTLVKPQHADYAEKIETNHQVKVIRFKDAGHLLHVTHAEAVNDLILLMLNIKENNLFDVSSERL